MENSDGKTTLRVGNRAVSEDFPVSVIDRTVRIRGGERLGPVEKFPEGYYPFVLLLRFEVAFCLRKRKYAFFVLTEDESEKYPPI